MTPIRLMIASSTGVLSLRLFRHSLCIGLLFILGLFSLPSLAVNIETSLDRNPVPVNESFTILFTADGEPDREPDFSPLQKDFEIISQNQSSQFSLVNGHASRQITWQIGVVARQPGALQVPAIAFGKDQSKPLTVNITYGAVRGKQGANADLFVEMEADPKNPYVQAQTRLTVRVLSRVRFSGELAEPKVEGAQLDKLDNDRAYLTDREGVQFNVNERVYAIFPQKSGRMTIDPVNLTAQLENTSAQSLLAPFGRSAGRTLRLHSDPVTLDVRPIPPQFAGKFWLPAAKLSLSEDWSQQPPQAAAGDPVTRTLTLRAEGATVGLLPELSIYNQEQANLKQYPDQPVVKEDKQKDSFVSTRQQKTALIGSKAGVYHFAAIEIPWWNTRTDRMEVARLPERTLTVTASTQSAPDNQFTAMPMPTPEKDVETSGADSGEITSPSAVAKPEQPFWFWLALFLGTGWLATVIAWVWRARQQGAERTIETSVTREIPERALIRAIEQACRNNDPAAARQSLTDWARLQWPDMGAMNLEDRVGGVLGREIGLLNRSLYSPGVGVWQGASLWAGFQDYLNEGKAGSLPRKKSSALQPLHKL